MIPSPAGGKFETLLKYAVYGLALVYLVNCFTPLRLHVDTLRYFAIKDCVEAGCPPGSAAAKDYLPWGYTGLLLFLSKLGILRSFVIVAINCAYLFGSLFLVKRMFGSSIHPFFFALLVLANWTTIKFVAHPLSEMQYLFFSMASLYAFQRFVSERKWLYLVLSFGFCALAFITRSVGIALAAALVVSLVWEYRKEVLVLIRRNKTLFRVLVSVIVLAVIGVAVFSRQLGLNHYTMVFNKQFNEGVTRPVILRWHFTEWAEICFNMSVVKLHPFLSNSASSLVFLLSGIVFFAGFLYLLFIRRNTIPFMIMAYLLCYSFLLFNWPFYDPRFWVPVIPLIAAVISQFGFGRKITSRVVSSIYLAGYLLLGLVSVAFFTYSSLDRKVMARTHANGVYRNEYETIFFGKPLSDTATHIDSAALEVIRRYDR
jgi:hypothetical protein